MTEDSQSPEAPSQGGVFGNLPDSRPGTRSPRRRSEGEAAAPAKRAKAARTSAPRSAGEKPAKPAPEPASSPPPRRDPTPPAGRGEGSGGIEDLAWAGVAAAAEAATLGVRLASRALETLRGSSERD